MGFASYLILLTLALFVPAGTTAWPEGWLAVSLLLGSVLGSRLLVLRRSPDLLAERARYAEVGGVEPWDRLLAPAVGMVGPLLVLMVAGLDHRIGWTPRLPAWVRLVGLLLVVVGYALAIWALAVNRFFSAVVRIQSERGHHVVQDGPYAYLRHPGYAGGVVSHGGGPLLLGSLWALVPAALMVAALAVRTMLEDQMLQDRLPGYRAYRERVRFRWIPGIW